MQEIRKFLQNDLEAVSKLIEKYPEQLPISEVADLIGCGKDSIRTALEEYGRIGIAWRKPGKLNHGYCIPTALFVRWYLNIGLDI